jgi:hypothetical protein
VVHHDDPDDRRAQEALRALRGKKRFRVDDTIRNLFRAFGRGNCNAVPRIKTLLPQR